MAETRAEIQLPYYTLDVTWAGPDGGTSKIEFTISNVDGGPNQGPAEDLAADAVRDWYAGQPNYASSVLRKIFNDEVTL